MNDNKILQEYQTLYSNYIQLANKINEIDTEKYEHQLVLDTIKNLEKDRVCHRLVGGVLIERTVGEVIPALEKSRDSLQESIDILNKELEKKAKELNEFKLKNEIKVKSEKSKEQDKKEERVGVLA